METTDSTMYQLSPPRTLCLPPRSAVPLPPASSLKSSEPRTTTSTRTRSRYVSTEQQRPQRQLQRTPFSRGPVHGSYQFYEARACGLAAVYRRARRFTRVGDELILSFFSLQYRLVTFCHSPLEKINVRITAIAAALSACD